MSRREQRGPTATNAFSAQCSLHSARVARASKGRSVEVNVHSGLSDDKEEIWAPKQSVGGVEVRGRGACPRGAYQNPTGTAVGERCVGETPPLGGAKTKVQVTAGGVTTNNNNNDHTRRDMRGSWVIEQQKSVDRNEENKEH